MRCLRRILQGRWRAAGSVCYFQQASLSGPLPMAICAAKTLQIMGSTRIGALPVVNAENELVGALDMYDLLYAGMV